MPNYELSLKMINAFLDPRPPSALSLPLAALIIGALSQVETTIELTNRICDRYFIGQFHVEAGRPLDRAPVSGHTGDEDFHIAS